MLKEIIEKLKVAGNTVPKITEVVAVPDAIGTVHRKDGKHSIWWYRIPDGKLEYSETARSHFDDDFDLADPESRKLVRGRIGILPDGRYFVLVYVGDFSGVLMGNVLADLLVKLERVSGLELDVVVDEEGHDLLAGVR